MSAEALPKWDGETPIDIFKWTLARAMRVQSARASKMAAAMDADGNPLYRVNENGSLIRTRQMPSKRREEVLERDGRLCVWCASPDSPEVDHIIRYIDGGSDEMDNLRTLCRPCHGSRGGRA